jgi:terminase small subunit / prophage DNA-packing protein
MTQAEIAAALDMNPRTFRDWVRRGVVPAGCRDALEAAKAIIGHLRKVAAGHVSVDGKLDLTAERARLARAQAEHHELKNALLRRDSLPRELVTDSWAGMVLDVKEHVRALPARARARIPGFTRRMAAELARLCDEALTAIADGGDGVPAEPRKQRKEE